MEIKVDNCLDCHLKEYSKDTSCDFICGADPKKRLVFHYDHTVNEVTVTFEEYKRFCPMNHGAVIMTKNGNYTKDDYVEIKHCYIEDCKDEEGNEIEGRFNSVLVKKSELKLKITK